ncbi:MAG: hypothetical protein LZF60_260014 [Nitrospira sp.]|nr:MAG: hypothetical protein LZF60_260014 [Nitrospira sp.]
MFKPCNTHMMVTNVKQAATCFALECPAYLGWIFDEKRRSHGAVSEPAGTYTARKGNYARIPIVFPRIRMPVTECQRGGRQRGIRCVGDRTAVGHLTRFRASGDRPQPSAHQ